MPRRAGILVPLFSLRSDASWGIGEFGDIARMAPWLHSAGLSVLQLLPFNEMPLVETSPYSPLSAMALEPQFVSMEQSEDFRELGGETALEADRRARLEAVRQAPRVDYAGVRGLKSMALRRAFARFRATEWASGSLRARLLREYAEEQAWWLEDYALFRALRARFKERPWVEWPASVRDREPAALAGARLELADEILYRQYVQWVADGQLADTRRSCGIAIFGDLPFMVGADSADVWVRQDEFRLDASIGVPPDAFSASGQDWNLPLYRWDVQGAGEFDWLRCRARRNAALFDGLRIDHVVGFYRTYFRLRDGDEGRFTPPDEAAQTTLGERVLEVLGSAGADIVAEDLGVIPDFVRASLARLGIPGYKVFRWERLWNREGQPFVDPADYPAVAVVTSGTHDTEPMAAWWEAAAPEERAAILAIPSLRQRLTEREASRALTEPPMGGTLRDAVLATLYASPASLLLLPVQDIFGWSDRINRPATVSGDNWTWRMPWPVNRLVQEPAAVERAAALSAWRAASGR